MLLVLALEAVNKARRVRNIVNGGYSKIKFPDGGRFLTDVLHHQLLYSRLS